MRIRRIALGRSRNGTGSRSTVVVVGGIGRWIAISLLFGDVITMLDLQNHLPIQDDLS